MTCKVSLPYLLRSTHNIRKTKEHSGTSPAQEQDGTALYLPSVFETGWRETNDGETKSPLGLFLYETPPILSNVQGVDTFIKSLEVLLKRNYISPEGLVDIIIKMKEWKMTEV